MAVFSTNQNKHIYVVPTDGDATIVNGSTALGTPVGSLKVAADLEGNIYFQLRGNGGIVRSDLIDPKSITYAKVTSPKMSKKKKVTLKFKNGSTPLSGQDYIVRINFRQLYGMSDEDIYLKYGAVHAYAGMTASNFYAAMAASLVKNFSRVYSPYLTISVKGTSTTNSTAAEITIDKVNAAKGKVYTKHNASTGAELNSFEEIATITEIYITEKTQEDEYVLGVKSVSPVHFEVYPTTVTDTNHNEVEWGDVTETYVNGLGNGYNIADLEYFCMGERGDLYRGIGWPNNIITKYFAKSTSQYTTFDVHFAYKGDGVDSVLSEKDIIIAIEGATVNSAKVKALIKPFTDAGVKVYADSTVEDKVLNDTTNATANDGILSKAEIG